MFANLINNKKVMTTYFEQWNPRIFPTFKVFEFTLFDCDKI